MSSKPSATNANTLLTVLTGAASLCRPIEPD
jgi:hypothetical protein